mgnify:CR=1 FL=1
MVTGEPDAFDGGAELFHRVADFKQADILESHRIAGGTALDHQILRATALGVEPDQFYYIATGGHPGRDMDFACVMLAQICTLENSEAPCRGGEAFDTGGM